MDFGVDGTENWGPGEIRGNAIRDVAALNKVEMLPWDEWGPISDSYAGTTDADFDRAIDELALVCAGESAASIAAWFDRYPVPSEMIT